MIFLEVMELTTLIFSRYSIYYTEYINTLFYQINHVQYLYEQSNDVMARFDMIEWFERMGSYWSLCHLIHNNYIWKTAKCSVLFSLLLQRYNCSITYSYI